jgi:Zn-dependent protease/CBS domain-containing protein
MPGRVPIGRVFGIQIRIDWSWLIALVLIGGGLAYKFAHDLAPSGQGVQVQPLHWLMGLLGALVLFLCVLLHEFSHALVARSRGVPINGITLFLFGGVTEMTQEPDNARQELLFAAAGPAMSGLLAVLFYAGFFVARSQGAPPALTYFLGLMGFLNLLLIAFNVVPGFPLDGGRILRAILWQTTGSLKRATYITTRVAVAVAYGLIAYGIFSVIYIDLISGLWMAFIGFFLKEAAESGYQQVLLKRALSGLRVQQVMSAPLVTVSSGLTLDKLVDEYFLQHRYKSFPVEDGGRLVGLVSLEDVKAVPRDRWPQVAVVQVMRTEVLSDCLTPESDVGAALTAMVQKGLGRIPVCLHGQPIGMVTRRDILQLFRIRTDLGS